MFDRYLREAKPAVDAALERLLPPAEASPARLHEAMRYAVFAGGKRVRPVLFLATAQRLETPAEELADAAASLELIHTFSLVHDDLPALDDDALRRGRPTVHVAYDEALAVLVGDALLGLGLDALTRYPSWAPPQARLRATQALAVALGSRGMIGGQVDDLEAEGQPLGAVSGEQLEAIHRRKTGALLVASLQIPAFYAEAGAEVEQKLGRLGDLVGLMFQMVDDILDIEGDAATLGKTAGKDVQADKLTYPRLYGLDETKALVARARDEALGLSADLPGSPELHDGLIEFLVHRDR